MFIFPTLLAEPGTGSPLQWAELFIARVPFILYFDPYYTKRPVKKGIINYKSTSSINMFSNSMAQKVVNFLIDWFKIEVSKCFHQ